MTTAPAEGIWHSRYIWVTLGAVAMIFMAATQSVAITTVMPLVSTDLHGGSLYAVAFAATLATSVIGMVAVGAWCDRAGAVAPLATATVTFIAGLAIAAGAPTMEWVVIGRLIQGLGTGGQTVGLYVVIARVFPVALHGRVFAAFSAAWILPSLIGPVIAGAVAQFVHWRWVFAGVAILTAIAFIMVFLRLRSLPLRSETPSRNPVLLRLVFATAVAAGAIGLSLSSEARSAAPIVVIVSAVVIAAAMRPLLPPGTMTLRKGLPSVVAMRGLIAGALFGSEVYIPYFLIDVHGYEATWAGLGLTSAAVTWAIMAEVQGRHGDRLGNRRIALLGTAQLFIALAGAALVAQFALPSWVVIALWAFAGSGMGLMYPRLTVLTLRYSTTQNQGFNSAALSIADAIGAATTIAVMGIVFLALGQGATAFVLAFLCGAAIAAAALIPGLRMDRELDLFSGSRVT